MDSNKDTMIYVGMNRQGYYVHVGKQHHSTHLYNPLYYTAEGHLKEDYPGKAQSS